MKFKKICSRLSLPFFFMLFFSLTSSALGAEVQFSWTPNSEPTLAGYKIYYGTASGDYTTVIDVGNPAAVDNEIIYSVTGLSTGITYYFTATAYDTDGFESDYADEIIWICPDSPAPVANDLLLTTLEDTAVNGSLDGSSQCDLPLTYEIISNGSLGTVTLINQATGEFSYIPRENIYGTDTFTYKVSDGNGESGVATVTVTISSVNDVAVAHNDTVTAIEDKSFSGQLTAVDADNDSLTYKIVSNASLGNVIVNGTDGTYTFTPLPNAYGSDNFTFQVNDGHADSNVASVSIEISPVNDSPVASSGNLTCDQNSEASGVLEASDIDDTSLTYTIYSNATLGNVIITNAESGAYQYVPDAGVFGVDEFQFQVADAAGALSEPATVSVTINQVQQSFVMEFGSILANSDWLRVKFSKNFNNPVVIVKPASNNDSQPCVVRIRNVNADGFEVRLQNWDYLADNHGVESVNFIAVESGSFEMPDGSLVEAGIMESHNAGSFVPMTFAQEFKLVPVMASSIITDNEIDAVAGRIRNISLTGFEFEIQEQEANVKEHALESVAYIAWEPSAGLTGNLSYEISKTADTLTHTWQTITFNEYFDDNLIFIADMQSTDGNDSANLRFSELTGTSVQLKVAEEQSKDSETSHTTEIAGFMAFGIIDLEADTDLDGLTTIDERNVYGSDPSVPDSDNDGLDDGVEVDYWGNQWSTDTDNDGLINLLDSDSDNDGYLDGLEVGLGYDPADYNSHPNGPTLEVDTLELSTGKQRVTFNQTFFNPVVVARVISENDSEPCVVQIENVDRSGFDIQLREWDYQDNIHAVETVSYMVMEQGSYVLDNGTRVEAGLFNSQAINQYENINFTTEFNVAPVVNLSTVSSNETSALALRMKNVGVSGFTFRMREQESNSFEHAAETISYIAWEPSAGVIGESTYEVSSTADAVKHGYTTVDLTEGFMAAPVIIADMQTLDGGDTSVVRCNEVGQDGFLVRIEEEQSRDTETSHTTEVVGYIAIN